MDERLMVVFLGVMPVLWMAGGKWWKGWRRYVAPAACALFATASGASLARGGLLFLGLAVVNSLGYGDSIPWWRRILVFGALALPVVVLDPAVALVSVPLTAGLLSGAFWLTRKYNRVTFKVWEALAGLLQAVGIAIALL